MRQKPRKRHATGELMKGRDERERETGTQDEGREAEERNKDDL